MPANVIIPSEDFAALKSLFGGSVPSHTSLAAIGWGIDGAEVMVVRSHRRKGGIDIETTIGRKHVVSMTIHHARGGLLVCDLSLMHLDENVRDPEQGVTGTHLFAKQVASLRGLGFTRINATAIGYKGAALIGYYALPRYGFEGRMSDEQLDRLPDSLRRLMARSRSLLKLLSLPNGPEAWKDSGDEIAVSFDLADGSSSMVAMSKYLAEKGIL
jgi:hypothetical protein